MLARTKYDMEKTLMGTVGMLHSSNPCRVTVQFKKITGMYTPLIKDVATNLRLEPLDYKFDFGYCVLNQSINLEHIKPVEWYMMPDV